MIRLRPRPDGYDERQWLSLKGLGELGEGEYLKLCLGETVVCGRSRHCQLSLKRLAAYLRQDDAGRRALREGLAWRSTSRRHCRITYLAPDMVDVENLSENGTFVNGHQVDRIVLTDCRRAVHEIRLGPHGLALELRPGALPLEPGPAPASPPAREAP